MAVPVLMALFTDDAVEVRYSDQSCLQLSPCGSTFVHHESPGQLVHPAHGMKTISQRCQFVTSDYRVKLLQALDFRNRFAERPFISQSLIEEDQVVPLYAKISTAAWPKSLEQANFEYMQNGGVRLISEDEFSSIVLSPHRQDFTVCYLCGVSLDSQRQKIRNIKNQSSKTSYSSCLKKEDNIIKCQIPENKVVLDQRCSKLSENKIIPNNQQQFLKKGNDDASINSRDIAVKLRDDLNISPISFASTQLSRESSPVNDSISEFKRYSTPTNIVQNPKTLVQKADSESLDGSFLQYTQKVSSQIRKPLTSEKLVIDSRGNNLSDESTHSNESDRSVGQRRVHWSSTNSDDSDSSRATSVDDQSGSQILYTWVTRHYSCEECPASWNHVLNMARAAIDNREQLEKYSSTTSIHINQRPRGIPKKINPENYCMAPLPESLPLTCPGQHLHKQYGKYVYDNDRDIVENIAALSKGKLKIVLIDGIVFRIVRLATTKFVEIYPGDGSVILSQGLGGHFYRHIMPHGLQLVERTYSLKALPPATPTAPYSIEKLIKRASRFLLQTNQEDKTLPERAACCWKHKDNTLIEPRAASLLEECTVPGHGRFSAFSNGHVRILFDDRTSLDMACDFSKRIMGCIEHSNDACEKAMLQQQLEGQTNMECRGKQGLCKLLLPNGQYQIVDSKHPGVYKRYTDAALEWAEWVNSSPNQRKIFYQNWNREDDATLMVAKELQKIKCFNYLADNAISSAQGSDSFDQNCGTESSIFHGQHSTPQQYRSCLKQSASANYASLDSQFVNFKAPVPRSQFSNQNSFNDPKELDMMRGFDSVREALLRTSSAIKDIDEILEKKSFKS